MAITTTDEMKITTAAAGEPAAAFFPQLSRYSVASIIALAIDFAMYIALCHLAVNPSLAGVVGYAIGMIAHYVMSTAFVFSVSHSGKSRLRRLAEFAASGLLGLGLTGLVIALLTQSFAVSVVLAKAVAVVVSFVAVYLVRRWIVFAAAPADEKNSDRALVY